jgi:hypothetical protein
VEDVLAIAAIAVQIVIRITEAIITEETARRGVTEDTVRKGITEPKVRNGIIQPKTKRGITEDIAERGIRGNRTGILEVTVGIGVTGGRPTRRIGRETR